MHFHVFFFRPTKKEEATKIEEDFKFDVKEIEIRISPDEKTKEKRVQAASAWKNMMKGMHTHFDHLTLTRVMAAYGDLPS